MNYSSPESKGISSAKIEEFIRNLEENELSTHNVILAVGDDIVFEKYWEPFTSDFQHRMYSVSKSIVAIAVGFCIQDGYFAINDKISDYFPDELRNQTDEYMKNQTIRDMLMMATAKLPQNWFTEKMDDRVQFYFENQSPQTRPSGTIFNYDSTGSFVLGALVERMTKTSLMDYLRIKLFDKIGVSKEATCLKCPGGHSWGDSAVICKPADLLLIAKFMMNKGNWNGEQLLSEEYVTDAVSKQIDNNNLGLSDFDTQGYGYLIWRTKHNGFFFNGMGCQFAVCFPDKDLIFIYNGDNQGKVLAKKIIFDSFFNSIYDNMSDSALPENEAAAKSLKAYTDTLKLCTAKGEMKSPLTEKINGVTYNMTKNVMGITKIRLSFNGDNGIFEYTNAQGDKKIEFKMCENAYGVFPEEGYSNEVGSVATTGFYYKCAASAAWVMPNKLFLKIQIIDKYFGVLNVNFGFSENKIGVYMNKCAEDFLQTYEGFAGGVQA